MNCPLANARRPSIPFTRVSGNCRISSSAAAVCTTRSNHVSCRERAEEAQEVELACRISASADAMQPGEKTVSASAKSRYSASAAPRERATPACTAWTLPAQSFGQASISTISKRSSPPISARAMRRRVVGAAIEREHVAHLRDRFSARNDRMSPAITRASLYAGTTTQTRPAGGSAAASVCPKRSVGTDPDRALDPIPDEPPQQDGGHGAHAEQRGDGDQAASAESSRPQCRLSARAAVRAHARLGGANA